MEDHGPAGGSPIPTCHLRLLGGGRDRWDPWFESEALERTALSVPGRKLCSRKRRRCRRGAFTAEATARFPPGRNL